MDNVIRPNLSKNNDLHRLYMESNKVSRKVSYRATDDGIYDKFSDLRLRLAIVDNYEFQRDRDQFFDPLDTRYIVNTNTGKIALKWIDLPGGVLRPKSLGGFWTYMRENDYYYPEDRDYNDYNIESRREMVSLTHPFIWTGYENYCGFNYSPPVGSVVIVGFRKHGFPLILGYLTSDFKICYPPLRPGEMVMKGYGNNYIHWRWSDKLDMNVKSEENADDIDDPDLRDEQDGESKANVTNCNLWLRLNSNDRHIEIIASETYSDENMDNWDKDDRVKYPQKPHGTHSTKLVIRPQSLFIRSEELNLDDLGESELKVHQLRSFVSDDTLEQGDQKQDIDGNILGLHDDQHTKRITEFYQNEKTIRSIVINPEVSDDDDRSDIIGKGLITIFNQSDDGIIQTSTLFDEAIDVDELENLEKRREREDDDYAVYHNILNEINDINGEVVDEIPIDGKLIKNTTIKQNFDLITYISLDREEDNDFISLRKQDANGIEQIVLDNDEDEYTESVINQTADNTFMEIKNIDDEINTISQTAIDTTMEIKNDDDDNSFIKQTADSVFVETKDCNENVSKMHQTPDKIIKEVKSSDETSFIEQISGKIISLVEGSKESKVTQTDELYEIEIPDGKFKVNSKNTDIMAKEMLELDSSKYIEITADKDITVESENIEVTIDDEATITSTTIDITASESIDINAIAINIDGSDSTSISTSEMVIDGSSSVDISSSTINLNSPDVNIAGGGQPIARIGDTIKVDVAVSTVTGIGSGIGSIVSGSSSAKSG